MTLQSLFQIRATRARPPARAVENDRRGTYGAALAQFDELMAAAAANSAAARPLPLFYALSQAGRAIAAARSADPWRLRLHGLNAPDLDGPLLSVVVKRAPEGNDKSTDSFTGVARATGSPAFDQSADLGALWSSLPEVFNLLPSPPATVPLLLVPEGVGHFMNREHVHAAVVGYDGVPEQLPDYLEQHFPTTAGVGLFQPQGLPHVTEHTDWGEGLKVLWRAEEPNVGGHLRTLQRVIPGTADFSASWLRPGASGVALSSLLTWWALLFGLSMLARYEPAGWAAALAYDSSELAAPLERLLDIALERVPELVFDALTSEATT